MATEGSSYKTGVYYCGQSLTVGSIRRKEKKIERKKLFESPNIYGKNVNKDLHEVVTEL